VARSVSHVGSDPLNGGRIKWIKVYLAKKGVNPFDILRQRDRGLPFSDNPPICSPCLPVTALNLQLLQSSSLDQICGVLYGSSLVGGCHVFLDGQNKIRGHNNRLLGANISRMSDAAFFSDRQRLVERQERILFSDIADL
jgi:hypothetical protein